jgi:catechol 2,3-dioxygenase-like lactoylglutathione lyase family enzyme
MAIAAARLGPALLGTVVCADLAESIALYRDWLGQLVLAHGRMSTAQALALESPHWIQSRVALLGPARRELPWLRLIEDPDVEFHGPFARTGWLSLEVSVADVDALARKLERSPFRLLAAPADLEMSANIRAMQVAGPSGEVLYLTQVKAPLPPFDLPRARHFVDRLFIPVLGAPDRERALKVYELLAQRRGMNVETRLGALNATHGWAADRRHPIAVLQLNQASMVEIDQLPNEIQARPPTDRLPGGIASVLFKTQRGHPLLRAGAAFLRGAAGEGIELCDTLDGLRNTAIAPRSQRSAPILPSFTGVSR